MIDIQLRQQGASEQNIHDLILLKQEAEESGFLEDTREVDRVLANATEDKNMILKVYYGTRFKRYKKRILDGYPSKLSIPDTFDCTLAGSSQNQPIFDYKEELSSTPNLLKLFHHLTKDLYRPLPLGYIFDSIYDEDFFDPFHTPDRIYALVKRLRAEIGEKHGININWSSSGVNIEASQDVKLRLHNKDNLNLAEDTLTSMRKNFGKKWFTSNDLASFLGSSKTTTSRWLNKAKETYKMEKEGRGKSTRYRFK